MRDFAQSEAAKTWLDERLIGPGRIGLPWQSLVAFVRLVTNPRVFERFDEIEWIDPLAVN